jgi:hypothetical protein
VIDLLDAEPLILARLVAQVTGVTGLNVTSSASIVDTLPDALMPKLPLLVVQPGAGEVTAYAGNGQAAAENGEWIVVAVVKLIPDPVALDVTYQSTAGVLIGKTLEALAGWAPAGYRPFRYAGRDEPVFSPGYVEFALRFTTQHMTLGTGG